MPVADASQAGTKCRVCRTWDHVIDHCPVMAAAVGVGLAALRPPARGIRYPKPEPCPWLERVPESTRDIMRAIQSLASEQHGREAGIGQPRNRVRAFPGPPCQAQGSLEGFEMVSMAGGFQRLALCVAGYAASS